MNAIIWRQCDCSIASAYCQPSAIGGLRGSRVHDPGRHEGDVPVAGHPDALEARVARLAGSPHPVLEPGLVAAVDDVDPGEEDVALQHRLAIADPLRERPGRDRLARALPTRCEANSSSLALAAAEKRHGPVAFRRSAGLPPPRRSPGSSMGRTPRSVGRSGSRPPRSASASRPRRSAVRPPDTARAHGQPPRRALHVPLDRGGRLREPASRGRPARRSAGRPACSRWHAGRARYASWRAEIRLASCGAGQRRPDTPAAVSPARS